MSECATLETITSFMSRLIDDVEHYRCDLFITYETILKLQEETLGLVLTRKNGCEFYSQESTEDIQTRYEAWKPEAVGFYLIRRTHENTYFGNFPAVQWQKISADRADRLIDFIQHGFRYPHYSGEQIRRMLLDGGIDPSQHNDQELEELGELTYNGFSPVLLVEDGLPKELELRRYNMCLKQIALEAGYPEKEDVVEEAVTDH